MRTEPKRISREYNGKTYYADYRIEDGEVILSTEWGINSAKINHLPVEVLAGLLLSEMVKRHQSE